MRVITWNVNSIKMRMEQVNELLKRSMPSVLMLQEVKAETFADVAGYNVYFNGQKSYNGVAILTDSPGVVVRDMLPGYGHEEARYLEVVCEGITFINVYVPFGQEVGSDKFKRKLEFLGALRSLLAGMRRMPVVVGGDFNVALGPMDTYAPIHDAVCYALEARKCLRCILNSGYYDPYRHLHPQRKKFSWWDYRNNGYVRDLGMRLDYFLLSPCVMNGVKMCSMEEEYRKMETPSDHIPVVLDLEKAGDSIPTSECCAC